MPKNCAIEKHTETNFFLQLIGTPSEEELEFLNENAKRYIRQLPPYPRQSITDKFPTVHPLAIDLIEKMLTFDPRRRITGQSQISLPFLTCKEQEFLVRITPKALKEIQYSEGISSS